MDTTDTALNRTAESIGTWLFISGLFILGPVGAALLCGVAYAMYFSNLALGVVCVLLLFAPFFLLTLWTAVLGASLLAERAEAKAELAAEVARR